MLYPWAAWHYLLAEKLGLSTWRRKFEQKQSDGTLRLVLGDREPSEEPPTYARLRTRAWLHITHATRLQDGEGQLRTGIYCCKNPERERAS